MRFLLQIICICLLTLGMSSCGFHLRGVQPVSPELKNLYLKTKDPYGQLTHNLQDAFQLAGIQLAESPSAANYVLDILSETQAKELISVSGTQQTRQYNLILTVTFRITTPNDTVVLAPQQLSETRVFTMQANQILGDSNEEIGMYQQMRRDIVNDIMNRIASPEVMYSIRNAKAHL